jgi:hypothetical protein
MTKFELGIGSTGQWVLTAYDGAVYLGEINLPSAQAVSDLARFLVSNMFRDSGHYASQIDESRLRETASHLGIDPDVVVFKVKKELEAWDAIRNGTSNGASAGSQPTLSG